MKSRSRFLIWAGFIASFANSATAQDPGPLYNVDDVPRLEVYLSGEEAARMRLDYVRMLQAARHPNCSEEPDLRIKRQRRHTYQLDEETPVLNFPEGHERPIDAAWYESYDVRSCGAREEVRARLTVHNGNLPEAYWRPPEDTRLTDVEIRLFWPVILSATTQARVTKSCAAQRIRPEIALVDVYVANGIGERLNPRRRYEWQERWTVNTCGTQSAFQLRINRNQETGRIQTISHMVPASSLPYSSSRVRRPRQTREERLEERREHLNRNDPYYRDRSGEDDDD